MLKNILFIVAVALLVWGVYHAGTIERITTDFTSCEMQGHPILESYPRQCRTPDGNIFTEDIGNELEKSDLIRSNTPRPNDLIESPITISGEARGYWFFEASFPVQIVDANNNVLANTFIMTDREWMTEDFVPFSKTITFETPTTDTGTVILHKDNPSGLPEHDDALIIPVRFK